MTKLGSQACSLVIKGWQQDGFVFTTYSTIGVIWLPSIKLGVVQVHQNRNYDCECQTWGPWKWNSFSCVQLFATSWAIQTREFSRPEYWSGQLFSSPEDLPKSRDWTQVSYIARGFFTNWTMREVHEGLSKVKLLSHVRLFATPWTVAYQVSPSMGFSRQEYWSGVPLPSPGDLPNPGTGIPHHRQTLFQGTFKHGWDDGKITPILEREGILGGKAAVTGKIVHILTKTDTSLILKRRFQYMGQERKHFCWEVNQMETEWRIDDWAHT